MSNHNDKNKLNSGKLLPSSVEDNPEPSKRTYRLICGSKSKSGQTGRAEKYPQGFFREKKCRKCDNLFVPNAPSELYCNDDCKDEAIADRYLKNTYGIVWVDYVRMFKQQQGRCAICGGEGFKMAEHHIVKLVVDHNHSTGEVRGLLCHNCNRAIGLLQENEQSFLNAIQYLKGATTIPSGSTLQANGGGSGLPLTGSAEGDDIV